VEQCPTGQVPKLLEENEGFIEFFHRASAGLFDGFGALRLEAVQTVCDLMGVPGGERPVILDLTLTCVKAIREIRETEKK
jgi:hypothetical protein